MKRLKLLTCFFVFVSISCNEAAETNNAVPQKRAIGLATIQLEDLNGDVINMQQYKGKVLFVNFWATWCKPCVAEMPSIAAVINKMKDQEIEFLFASDEDIDQIADFKSSHDYTFNYVQARNTTQLNITALPTTYIFDKNGELVFNEMGARNWNDKENIDLLLNLGK